MQAAEFQGTQRFEVLSRLGEGGMGVVYEAYDHEHDTKVALKTLRFFHPETILHLKNEFRSLQDIHHPNLVRLGELVEEQGVWFFTMELVDGVSFLDYVRRRAVGDGDESSDALATTLVGTVEETPGDGAVSSRVVTREVDEARLRSALGQVAKGLHGLHAAGKVHRDIKPSNILVRTDGRVVILDFGLVTDAETRSAEAAGSLVGTIAYMAPEQAATKSVGPPADWYSVGVLLYEALTGRLPFSGAPLEILSAKQRGQPPPPRDVAPAAARDLDSLCTDLLCVDPSARPSGIDILQQLHIEDSHVLRVPTRLASSSGRDEPILVGRDRELDWLETAFRDMRKGRAVSAVIHGRSGVGKTALVREFLAWLDSDVVVLQGRCYEREWVPYRAFDGIVDALSVHLAGMDQRDVAALVPADAALLAGAFPVLRRVSPIARAERKEGALPDPHEQRRRVFAALRELLSRLAARAPLVLSIDDMQWADADSLALLREIMAEPEAPLLLFVSTVRTHGGEERVIQHTREFASSVHGDVRLTQIDNLSADAAVELAGELAARWGAEREIDAEHIASEAAGHPMFIDELVRHAAMHGALEPGTVRLDEALWTRIAWLRDADRSILEAIAVVGGPMIQETAALAVGMPFDAYTEHVALLRVAHLVRTTGSRTTDRIELYHDRIRNAISARLSAADERQWHERIAHALEASPDPDPEALMVHLRGMGRLDRAAEQAVVAADKAVAALAFDRAARLYRIALECEPAMLTTRSSMPAHYAPQKLRTKLADALANAGRGAEAAVAYLGAAGKKDTAFALELRRRAAEQLLRSGRVDEGFAALKAVLEHVGVRFPATSRRALLGFLARRARIRLRGLSFRERDESRVAAHDLTRVDVLWSAATVVGLVDNVRGAYFQSHHLLAALECGEPYRVARALTLEIVYRASSGPRSTEQIETLIARTRELAERTENPHALGLIVGIESMVDYLRGDWEKARRLAQEAGRIFREECLGVAWELSNAHLFWAMATARTGKYEEIAASSRLELRGAEQRGDLYHATNLRASVHSALLLAEDDPTGARECAEQALAAWSESGVHSQHFFAIYSLAQADLYDGDAEAAYQRLLGAWRMLKRAFLFRVQFIRIEAWELRGRAALAWAQKSEDPVPLLRHASRAANRLDKERLPWAHALAVLLRAGVASASGDLDEARSSYATANEAFSGLGMLHLAAVAKRRLGQLTPNGEGADMVAEADAVMRRHDIANPSRMATVLAGTDWIPSSPEDADRG